jgi:hypothetical protein
VHAAVPSLLPQPKLKRGAARPAGLAVSLTAALGTLPPVAQTVTVQSAACPAWLLACAGVTWMHRLGAVCVTAAGAPG